MDTTQANPYKTYFENLDGLRALAFIVVFLSHCLNYTGYYHQSLSYAVFSMFCVQGDLGVNFFFVLSGFLISYLLFNEFELKGKVNARHFYFRRILRIWPAYFLLVAAGFFVFPDLPHVLSVPSNVQKSVAMPLEKLPWFLLFVANFALLLKFKISFILVGLWSVSVEEQFYLVWPLLINAVKPRRVLKLMWILILISLLYRCHFYNNITALKYSSLSVLSDFCFGVVIAHYCVYSDQFIPRLKRLQRRTLGLVYLSGFLLMALHGRLYSIADNRYTFYLPMEAILFSAFFAFIILEQTYCPNSFYKVGQSRLLSYIGRISYGMYIYHTIAILAGYLIVTRLSGDPERNVFDFGFTIFISLLVTFLLAFFSYIALEKRLLKLKKKYPPA